MQSRGNSETGRIPRVRLIVTFARARVTTSWFETVLSDADRRKNEGTVFMAQATIGALRVVLAFVAPHLAVGYPAVCGPRNARG